MSADVQAPMAAAPAPAAPAARGRFGAFIGGLACGTLIAAISVGGVLYWRESDDGQLYRRLMLRIVQLEIAVNGALARAGEPPLETWSERSARGETRLDVDGFVRAQVAIERAVMRGMLPPNAAPAATTPTPAPAALTPPPESVAEPAPPAAPPPEPPPAP